MKKTNNTQAFSQEPVFPLITRERTDKLDLLHHLTANLARTVIVCGPDGIGKTHLLTHFKGILTDSAILCTLTADSQLNLAKVQEHLSEAIAQKNPGLKSKPLADALEHIPGANPLVVLLIDDAGKLAPRKMERIIVFARDNPVLRVVFALTHSELYLKNTTDPSIDDCYQIEIPPLTELQCADFLEYLSTLPNPRIDFNAINEVMVADLYRETHGIPGNILDKLPQPKNLIKVDRSNIILTGAVASLIAIALGVQWWSSRPKPAAKAPIENPQATVSQQPQVANVQQASQSTQVPDPAITNNTTKSEGAVVDSQNTAAGQAAQTTQSPNAQATDKSVQTPLTITPDQAVTKVSNAVSTPSDQTLTQLVFDEGGQWVMKQPGENHTLQLMALSDEKAIVDVMQRHKELGSNLRYLKTTTKRGRSRFVLLYGSFADPEQARVEAKNLPRELHKTWPRKMSAIQAELNPIPPTTAPQ